MTPAYRVELTPAAVRDLRRLDRLTRHRIAGALADLARQEDPYRHLKHLHASSGSGLYALRVGEYRVIMALGDAELVIFVIEIGHRSTVYRRF